MTHCLICKRRYSPLRKGRCHACNEYWRRHGIERTKENLKKKTCIHGHPYTAKNVYVDNEGSRHCRICHRLREYKARKEPEELFRHKVRKLLGSAVRSGRLKRPRACERCSIKCKPDGHHPDYSKPFEVQWLCPKCHRRTDLRWSKWRREEIQK